MKFCVLYPNQSACILLFVVIGDVCSVPLELSERGAGVWYVDPRQTSPNTSIKPSDELLAAL